MPAAVVKPDGGLRSAGPSGCAAVPAAVHCRQFFRLQRTDREEME